MDALEAKIAELLDLAAQAYDAGRISDTEHILAGLRAVTQTHLEVNKRLGILLAGKGEFAAARAPLEDAARADEKDDVILFVLSACAFQAGEFEVALGYADRSLRLRRTSPDAHTNRGNALLRLGRPAEALEAFRAVQMLTPRDAATQVNLANALSALERHAEALQSLERALVLQPGLAAAQLNRGNVLQRLGRHAEALGAFDAAIALDSGSVDAHCNRGICRLLLGDYAGGWPDYEWRWRRDVPDFRSRGFASPLWLGAEDLSGRSILLHQEQGHGDSIQFVRYVGDVAARGATVILEVHPALADLFGDLPGVAQLVRRGEPLPPFDFHCPLMSLPLALGAPEPSPDPAPYLAAPAGRRELWAERLGPKGAPRVGLVVSGSTTHGNDSQRSLSFATLASYLPVGPEYHLLQKEVREADRQALAARADVRVWDEGLADFADTAALVELMDLIVSVDTSVAHLAGAIGRPTALLLPAEPDWRWGLGAATTPWYAGMRLYRQAKRGDWSEPLRRLAGELASI